MKRWRGLLVVGLAATILPWGLAPASAVEYGGVEFPEGDISFADVVAAYEPVIKSGEPIAEVRDPAEALGPPDFESGQENFVSLGDGGTITVRFTDNALMPGGDPAPDLWIFEIGPDVEDTFIEVSTDGETFVSVGKVFGSTSGVDLDAMGFEPSDRFFFVRLTDDTDEGQQRGATVGADIDSVGAISTVPTEGPFGDATCSDQRDNDGDGLTDDEDPDCEPPCLEDGLSLLGPTGILSGVLHGAEPALTSIDPSLAGTVHQLNCELVVPIEDALDGLGTLDNRRP